MKETLVFVGPTLFGHNLELQPDEILCPPASKGDIARVVKDGNVRQIVLIDGTFHQKQSVWHKELLWAMVNGIRCIGAASMGALRAAELWRYGMIGVGRIYENYKSTSVTDDAWVAMSYDPETHRILRDAPCGYEQKLLDMLEAIKFSRSKFTQPVTHLTREEVEPLFQRLEEVLYG